MMKPFVSRKFSIVIVFFLLAVTMIGCQDDHISPVWNDSPPALFGDSFLVVGDSRSRRQHLSGDCQFYHLIAVLCRLSDPSGRYDRRSPAIKRQWKNFSEHDRPRLVRSCPWYAVVGNHDVGSTLVAKNLSERDGFSPQISSIIALI